MGIVIGIAAVITLLSLGEGAQSQVTSTISSLGSNLVTIFPGKDFQGPNSVSAESQLTNRDYNFLNNKSRFPQIAEISPYTRRFLSVRKGSEELSSSVQATASNINVLLENLEVAEGSFFSESDVVSERNVIVVGSDIVTELFPEQTASEVIGQSVLLKNLSFQIIGVLGTRQVSGFNNPNSEVFVPYTTAASRLFLSAEYGSIYLTVADTQLVDAVVVQIEDRLSTFRNTSLEDKDFTVFTSEDILSTASQVTAIFTTLLSSIAGISLLVGGIGISNIMLVSVTERTREIGLRKAVGARQIDILGQFLVEAVLLTLLGGVIGISLGIGLALLIGRVANLQATLSLSTILLATSVSAVVGIVFGFFPALKAARLDPIVALRYE